MSRAIVGRWGKSLAIRIPAEIAGAVGIDEGEPVEVEAKNSDIVIRRAEPRFVLSELFRGKDAAEWRSVYAGAFGWGPDVGREVVEESAT